MSWLSVGFSFTREVRKWFLMTWLTYNNGCMLFNILDNPGNIYFQKMMSFWTLFLQLFPGCFFLSRWLLLGWSLLPTLPNCIINSFYFVIHIFQLCTLTCTALLFILHSLEWWNLIFGVHAKVLSFINNFFYLVIITFYPHVFSTLRDSGWGHAHACEDGSCINMWWLPC